MITKEQLQQMSDSELLDMVTNAKGHTGKDFGATFDCDFSYSFLTGELQKRGYENGFYKPIEKMSDDEIRAEFERRNLGTVPEQKKENNSNPVVVYVAGKDTTQIRVSKKMSDEVSLFYEDIGIQIPKYQIVDTIIQVGIDAVNERGMIYEFKKK